MTEPFTCVVSADLFRRAQFGVSKDETRYYLNGVNIKACKSGGAILTATDGRIVVSIRDPRGVVTGAGTVQLKPSLLSILKATAGDMRSPHLSSERIVAVSGEGLNARAMVAVSGKPFKTGGSDEETDPRQTDLARLSALDQWVMGYQWDNVVIDDTFPDTGRVIPKELKAEGPAAMFDHTLLSRCANALCAKGRNGIKMFSSGTDQDLYVMRPYDDEIDGFAVIMPMRNDRKAELPGFAIE